MSGPPRMKRRPIIHYYRSARPPGARRIRPGVLDAISLSTMLRSRRLLLCLSMLVTSCGSSDSSSTSDGGVHAGGATSGGTTSAGGMTSAGGTSTSSGGSGASSSGGSGASSSGGSGASSGGTAGANGGRSGSGAAAGAGGGDACPPECFVENECVTACGQTPQSYGCCPCPAGKIDARSCPASPDAGSVSCDPRRILCKRVAPICAEGEVPSVSGSCYGPCVKVETCPCAGPEECPESDKYTCHMNTRRCGPYVR